MTVEEAERQELKYLTRKYAGLALQGSLANPTIDCSPELKIEDSIVVGRMMAEKILEGEKDATKEERS